MTDEATEQHEEELAERDRIGEKSPSADAAFGGRGDVGFVGPGPLVGYVVEHKDGSHIPADVADRQRRYYERLLRVAYPRRRR